MTENKNILIIGSSKGIGKGLYNYYIKNNYNVFGTTRSKNLKNKYNNKLINLDLCNDKSIVKIKINKHIKFSYVFFVAGITPESKYINEKKCHFKNLDYQQFQKILKINCYSQIKLFEHLYYNNFFCKNAKAIFISSKAGSINLRGKLKHNKKGGNIIYRISKSALNSSVRNIAYDLKDKKIILLLIDPGWVNTTTAKNKKDQISIQNSVDKITKILPKINKNYSGLLIDLNKNILPY